MHDSPQRALVLARWNSWVRVWLPELGEVRWVDLGETEFQAVAGARSEGADDAAARS